MHNQTLTNGGVRMICEEDVVFVGQFTKPHGIKGEITLATTYKGLFEESDEPYVVCEMDGIFVPFYIDSFRPKGTSAWLVKLEGVDDEVAAKKFTDKAVYYPVGLLSDIEEDDSSWERFIGYVLADVKSGDIGTVVDVDESTANVLFRVDDNGTERLIPIAPDMVSLLDKQGKRIIMSLPEGILDLN